MIDRATVAPRYRSGNLEAALAAAERIPRLAGLARNYRSTGHPACLNAILDNATGTDSGPVWLAFHTASGDGRTDGGDY